MNTLVINRMSAVVERMNITASTRMTIMSILGKIETIFGIVHILYGIGWSIKSELWLIAVIPVSSGIYMVITGSLIWENAVSVSRSKSRINIHLVLVSLGAFTIVICIHLFKIVLLAVLEADNDVNKIKSLIPKWTTHILKLLGIDALSVLTFQLNMIKGELAFVVFTFIFFLISIIWSFVLICCTFSKLTDPQPSVIVQQYQPPSYVALAQPTAIMMQPTMPSTTIVM